MTIYLGIPDEYDEQVSNQVSEQIQSEGDVFNMKIVINDSNDTHYDNQYSFASPDSKSQSGSNSQKQEGAREISADYQTNIEMRYNLNTEEVIPEEDGETQQSRQGTPLNDLRNMHIQRKYSQSSKMFFNLKKKSLDEAYESKKGQFINQNFLIGLKKTPPLSELRMSFESKQNIASHNRTNSNRNSMCNNKSPPSKQPSVERKQSRQTSPQKLLSLIQPELEKKVASYSNQANQKQSVQIRKQLDDQIKLKQQLMQKLIKLEKDKLEQKKKKDSQSKYTHNKNDEQYGNGNNKSVNMYEKGVRTTNEIFNYVQRKNKTKLLYPYRQKRSSLYHNVSSADNSNYEAKFDILSPHMQSKESLLSRDTSPIGSHKKQPSRDSQHQQSTSRQMNNSKGVLENRASWNFNNELHQNSVQDSQGQESTFLKVELYQHQYQNYPFINCSPSKEKLLTNLKHTINSYNNTTSLREFSAKRNLSANRKKSINLSINQQNKSQLEQSLRRQTLQPESTKSILRRSMM
ncbi:UNKNOWN [Stylonychia lemnae]|uniref:Uncharacterized protein n=1 Tax=Stylonychia lemnae TaxID=5949 RepID=A0A077ZR21_STYLE|nr:UNKNOWN [Stylonychia lemnae]|eukprot:CDW72358.1 UNKNOWN [Stylonychia lemnae]